MINESRVPALVGKGIIELGNSHTTECIDHVDDMYKVIVTNNFVELYVKELKNISSKQYDSRLDRSSEYSETSNKQSYRRLKSIVMGNFGKYAKFVTLTFPSGVDFDVKDLTVCNYRKQRYLKRLRKTYPDIKYVIIPEYQGNGSVHYHMICDLPYISDLKKFSEVWGYPLGCQIEAIKDVGKTLEYAAKYISKNFGKYDKMKGRRRFYCSSNIVKPIEYRGELAREFSLQLSSLQPLESRSYMTPFSGAIHYYSYYVDAIHFYDDRLKGRHRRL